MTPSDDLFGFLRGWEGVDGGMPALKAYQKQGDVPTIGFGHTQGVRLGDTCVPEQADQWLADDLAPVAQRVSSYVTVPLEQHRFDALCSFAFNLGTGALHGSTLLKLVNGADFVGAALEFTKWDHSGGKEVAGLLKRRNAEAHIFIDGDYSARP